MAVAPDSVVWESGGGSVKNEGTGDLLNWEVAAPGEE